MREMDISIAGIETINTVDLYETLKSLGIQQGDIICVHSHLMGFGKPTIKKQDFLKAIVETLIETVGYEGTLIMPAFSYSFCKNEIFDMENTPSVIGILTEYFRKLPGVKRTWHPIFSFAIGGKMLDEYLDVGPDAFGHDSVYGKMLRDSGKIVMLGGNYGYTFYHLCEEHVDVNHRYFKNFSGTIINRGRVSFVNVPYFVRNLEMKSSLDEEKLSCFLLEEGCQKQLNFAKGTIAVVDCKEMYDTVCGVLKIDEKRFLKE